VGAAKVTPLTVRTENSGGLNRHNTSGDKRESILTRAPMAGDQWESFSVLGVVFSAGSRFQCWESFK
jgi:hypothetical protein